MGNDLIELESYSDPDILESIYSRFWLKNIYTFSGSSLISLNPHDSKMPIYSDKYKQRYRSLLGNPIFVLNSVKPHLYSIAINSLHLAKYDQRADSKTSICLSGESGSGKTFAANKLNEFVLFCFQDQIEPISLKCKVMLILTLDKCEFEYFRGSWKCLDPKFT